MLSIKSSINLSEINMPSIKSNTKRKERRSMCVNLRREELKEYESSIK